MLSNIDSVVNRNGFKLNSISFDKYDGEGYNLSPSVLKPSIVRLSISGQYDSLINFLKDLESLPMHAVVEGIRFSIPQDGDDISFSLSREFIISQKITYFKVAMGEMLKIYASNNSLFVIAIIWEDWYFSLIHKNRI